MSFLDEITVLILTYNEEANIGRTLAALSRFPRILILDSGSDDATLDIARQFSNVEIASRPFDTFANQCNYGLSLLSSEWVLSLDADYVLSDALVKEIASLRPSSQIAGYQARFKFVVHGKVLRGTSYPPRTVLYRRALARYRDEGHGHRVQVDGPIATLNGHIFHDDRKPLRRWFLAQAGYAQREADFLLHADVRQLRLADRLRRMGWPMILLAPLHALLIQRCVLDGLAGWHYALQRMAAECMIALALVDKRLEKRPKQ